VTTQCALLTLPGAIDIMRTSGIDKVGLITANLEAGK